MKQKSIISNPVLDKLPKHLFQYVLPQNYESYSAINQATWRYVMRKNVDYLKQVAHHSYLTGLEKTGISTEFIPSMYGMNRILAEIAWAAVAVDGLIPTAAFLEFQAYNVLVIASDIRQLENIEYTPSPDIIHESAGHAPIIANPEYAEYLRRIGEIGCKAISSHKENALFEAVRTLASIKEKHGASLDKINAAQSEVDRLQADMGEQSEMSRIKSLHWWTVEYGLIGNVEDPKIYGAGLLSSIGESTWCMSDQVKKIPYTLDAAYQDFDVTRPQPQLYVTPDFAHLSFVLEQFANRMALRKGGLNGVQKLIGSKKLGTIELSTGLQISGLFNRVIEHEGRVAYVHCEGPTTLSYREKELIGHSTSAHPDGFGSPIGKLRGINLAIEDMSPRDLEAYDIYEARIVELEFVGGIKVKGEVITGTRNLQGKIIVITFQNCLITYQDEVLFEPNWGLFHLAVGKEIIAAYAGPADYDSFDLLDHKIEPNIICVKNESEKNRDKLYQEVRDQRESKNLNIVRLNEIYENIKSNFNSDWLLILEIYELVKDRDETLSNMCLVTLKEMKLDQTEVKHLIDGGLEMLKNKEIAVV